MWRIILTYYPSPCLSINFEDYVTVSKPFQTTVHVYILLMSIYIQNHVIPKCGGRQGHRLGARPWRVTQLGHHTNSIHLWHRRVHLKRMYSNIFVTHIMGSTETGQNRDRNRGIGKHFAVAQKPR